MPFAIILHFLLKIQVSDNVLKKIIKLLIPYFNF